MNTTQINCFISLGKTLSFSKTADELFMTQPAISKNIKKLETELGVQLVKRDKGKVSLTENGRFFWNKISIANDIVNDAVKQMHLHDTQRQVTITIGYTNVPFERAFLPKLIRILENTYGYRVNLKNINPGEKAGSKALIDEKIDFFFFQEDLFIANKELDCTPLFKGGFSAVISKYNHLSSYRSLSLNQLSGLRIVMWRALENVPAISELKMVINRDYPNLDVREVDEMSNLIINVAGKDVIGIVPNFLYDPDSHDVNYVRLDIPLTFSYSVGYRKEITSKSFFEKVIHAIKIIVNQERKHWQ